MDKRIIERLEKLSADADVLGRYSEQHGEKLLYVSMQLKSLANTLKVESDLHKNRAKEKEPNNGQL